MIFGFHGFHKFLSFQLQLLLLISHGSLVFLNLHYYSLVFQELGCQIYLNNLVLLVRVVNVNFKFVLGLGSCLHLQASNHSVSLDYSIITTIYHSISSYYSSIQTLKHLNLKLLQPILYFLNIFHI